jgi:rhamnose transport system ATP-binding protein
VTEPVLSLRGLAKSFGGVKALTNGSLNLYAGQAVALIGENGAGKSTLVKAMTGVQPPDAGEILIDGAPVRVDTPTAAGRLGISAVFQESTIFNDLTVAENILFTDMPRKFGLIDWSAMRARSRQVLADLHTDIDPDLPASRLSVAQKHMVQIARALAGDARVVILDEPTAALSHQEAEELFRLVRLLKDQGKAILFISHKFEEVFEICERYAVFRDGAAVGEGMLSDIDTDGLIKLMVGRDLSQIYPDRTPNLGAEALSVAGLSRGREFADVSFSVRRGEILGVYGLVGAGRSEVMQTLFGLTQPDAGEIRIAGSAVTIKSPGEAIAHRIAYVPEDRQHQGAILDLPIRDNISLPSLKALSRGGLLDGKREREVARELGARFQIKAADLGDPVQSLSGGNQQKVVLAKWMNTEPTVLILDEPTKGVDVGSKSAVHTIVADLAAKGMAVIMVSSDLPEVLGMADRVIVMRRGRVRASFDRASATPQAVMQAATDA